MSFTTYIFYVESNLTAGYLQMELMLNTLLKGTTGVLLVGFKPSTSKLPAQVPYHYATLPPMCIQTFSNSLLVGDIYFS